MRAVVATVVVAAALLSAQARADITGWVGIPLESGTGSTRVDVPNVVGEASYAAADLILEALGLDAGTEIEQCSDAVNNSVVLQDPSAGTRVDIGTIVNLWTSTGVACRGGRRTIGIKIGIGQ